MKKKVLMVVLLSLISLMALTGCKNDSEDINVLSFTDTTLYAYVDDVSDKTLTITLGDVVENMDNANEPVDPSIGNTSSVPNDPAINQNSSSDSSTKEATTAFKLGSYIATLIVKDESVIANSKTISDISVGSIIEIVIDNCSNITSIVITDLTLYDQNGSNQMGENNSTPTSYNALTVYNENETVSNQSFNSTGTDENAVLITNSATVLFNEICINRSSSDSQGGDSSSFYGVGACLLVIDGVSYVNGGTIDSDASGAAGAFAYNEGTIYMAGTVIHTSGNTAGGIHVAGGGKLYAWNLTVTTEGESSAAIRSDRGGGDMVIDGGTYTSNGVGSPAVYCTANIAINNATLVANGSEAVCIEGKNSLKLFHTDLSGNMSDNEQNDTTWTVIIYQSMSGDSEIGNGSFSMIGGSLTSENGGLLYTTNTESHILLSDVKIKSSSNSSFFLKCTGNQNKRGWGSVGSNGANCTFTGIDQTIEGNIVWDSVSNLNFYLLENSNLTGAFIDDETNAGLGGNGTCSLYLSSSANWIVTKDSYLTNLYSESMIKDCFGSVVTIKGMDGTIYVQGSSSYVITVSSYSNQVLLEGADSLDSFNAYQISKPDAFIY